MRKNITRLIVCVAIVMSVIYPFHKYCYLPGTHISGRFHSINEAFTCYWYDDEAKEFSGDHSTVNIKVKGFNSSKNWNDTFSQELQGKITVEGYEVNLEENEVSYTGSKEEEWYKIVCTEYYVEVEGQDSRPAVRTAYTIYIHLDNPEQNKVCIERPEGKLWGFCSEKEERN